jgi:hypothetical protein
MDFLRKIALALAVASCQSPQVETTVKQGQLFCAEETATGPLTVALANALGAPVSVTNQTSTDVAAACALINAIPVVPPTMAVPTVATGTTLPPA